MNLETELLEITNDNLSEAQFMASNFIDVSVQNRVFFNVIGSEAVISYLGKMGIDVENVSSIHSIKRIVEKIDIADIILDNIHIDARVVFDDRELFIPKTHYELGIVPDIYAFLKYDRSFQRINFIGFIEPSQIDLSCANDEYYFVNPEKLHTPFDMLNFINNFDGKTDKGLSDGQILRGRELSVAVADHDVTDEEFKEFISLLSKSSVLRSSVLEYDNFETLASKVARALQLSKEQRDQLNEVVDYNDFINMSDESTNEQHQKQESTEKATEQLNDLNGDDLLDDAVDTALDAVKIAGVAGAVAGAVNAVGASAVSKEAMDLAGMAGDIVADEAEKLLDDDSADVSDFIDDATSETEQTEDESVHSEIEDAEIHNETVDEEKEIAYETENEQVLKDESDEDLENFPSIENVSEDEIKAEEPSEDEQFADSASEEVSKEDISAEPEQPKGDNTEQTEGLADLDDIEINEDLDFANLDFDELPFSDDLISEEPSDKRETDTSQDDITDTPSETEDLLSDESETGEKDNTLSDEPDISEETTTQDTELSDDEIIFADEDLSAEQTEEEEANEPEIAQQQTESPESGESSVEDNKIESDVNTFDIGDSLDIHDEDTYADIFDTDKEYDFDDFSEAPTGEIADDFELTEEPSEEPEMFEQEESLNNEDNVSHVTDETLQDSEEQTSESEDEKEDDEANPFEDSNDGDDENNPLSDWDGEFTDEIEADPEAGDDDLVLTAEPNQDSENLVQIEDASELESLSESDMGMELPVFVPPEIQADAANEDAEMHDFEELPTEDVRENGNNNDEYGLVNFSDLTDITTPEPYNAEVSFADVEDFANFETVAPIDDNSDIDYYVDDVETIDITDVNAVKENSVAISDKTHTPGEIFIDINKDSSSVGISSTNEHLEELYGNNNMMPDESSLNNDVANSNDKGKTVPVILGIGGIAFVLLIAGIIMFSIYKFMNPNPNGNEPPIADNYPQNNNLGEDVPNMNVDNNGVIMNDNQQPSNVVPSEGTQNNQGAVNQPPVQVQHATKPIPATSFLSVKKLSWEVPDYVSADSNFRQYFQSAGKSLKASLSSDLLLATDYTYSDQIRVSILYGKDGAFQRAKILLSSGSSQVDNIVLQSVNQTLKVLKAPNSLGNDQSTTVILKIYL